MKHSIITLMAFGLAVASAQAANNHKSDQHDYHVDSAKLHGKEFKTLAAAKSACGSSPVVWLNPTGVVFHTSTSRWFGHTSTGTYTCRDTAKAAGYWQSKY
jgi:hypothetical protein